MAESQNPDQVTSNTKESDVNGKNIKEECQKTIQDVSSFEDLLDIVGTNGKWNIMLYLLCAYGKDASIQISHNQQKS